MGIAPGTRLGVFEVVSLIGRGGMGEVYAARDLKLGREVALKVLPENLVDQSGRLARFEQEARVLAALDHPNIAGIYDFQEVDGRHFLVMQLVEGETLTDRLSRGPLAEEEAVGIFSQLAAALSAAHRRGIVHRDLKPANIKLGPGGRVKVLDFGIAKSFRQEAPPSAEDTAAFTPVDPRVQTQAGALLGTPAYMSPEQVRGEYVDARSDIWAFGCCLFQALTGALPFGGGNREAMWAAIVESEPDWARLPADLSAELEQLLRRCLRKAPAHRFRDMDEAHAVLLRLAGDPSSVAALLERAKSEAPEAGFRAFMFTQVVGADELRDRLGVSGAEEALQRHTQLLEKTLAQFGGVEKGRTGDSVFGLFELPSSAVRWALAFRQALVRSGLEGQLQVRVGIHGGEVTDPREGAGEAAQEAQGQLLDVAVRVMGLCSPGQVLLTAPVFDVARQQVTASPEGEPLEWLAHGLYSIKGLPTPVQVYEVGVQGLSPLHPPTDTATARRSQPAGEEDLLGWRPAKSRTVPGRAHWVLRQHLGEGGFGEVWLAEHEKTRERRVFKFCFQPERLRGLRREVVLFRLLRDTLGERPDIARILDWQFEKAPHYLEAEYTEAGSLDAWVEARGGLAAIPLDTRLAIVARTAEALAAAHSVGVLHKDIKPANILIVEGEGDDTPRIRLTDFGIGLVLDRDILDRQGISLAGLTKTLIAGSSTSSSGTPLYMAPELLEGKPPTTQSDTYALGVLLYQLVAGDLSRALAPGWERDVEAPLLREDIAACVQGNVSRRLGGATELAERLCSLDERWRRRRANAQRERRKRMLVAISAALTALTIVVVLMGFQWQRQAALEKQLRERAEQLLYGAKLTEAQEHLLEADFEMAMQSLEDCPERLRSWEWGYLLMRCNQDLMTFLGDSDRPMGYLMSPDGNLVVTLNFGEPVSFSVWDAATGSLRGQYPFCEGCVPKAADFHPNSSRIAIGTNDGYVTEFKLDDGEVIRRWQALPGALTAVTYSPNGELVAAGGYNPVTVWRDGRPFGLEEGYDLGIGYYLAFSRDSKYLANSDMHRRTGVVDIQSGDRLFSYEPELVSMANAAPLPANFCGTGRHFIYHDDTGQEHVVEVGSWDEVPSCSSRLPVTRLLPHSDRRQLPGKEVLVGLDERIKLWPRDVHGAVRVLDTYGGAIHWVTASPDGRLVAAKTGNYEVGTVVQVLDRGSGAALRTMPVDMMMVGCGFSPDSSAIPVLESTGQIRLIEIANGNTRGRLSGEEAYSKGGAVYFDDTGTRVGAVFRGGRICVFDSNSCRKLTEFGEPYHAVGGVFSPDFSLCATGYLTEEIRVYDVMTETLLYERACHGGWMSATTFSQDGGLLLVTSMDGTASLLDARSGTEVATYGVQEQGIKSAAITPDEASLVTMGLGEVILWDYDSGDMLLSLKELTGDFGAMSHGPDGTFLVLNEGDKVTVHPAFPWDMSAYPGDDNTPFRERVELYKRAYWKE